MTTPNTLLVRWQDGYVEVRDDESIGNYGRQKGFLALGDVTTQAEAERLATRELSRISTPQDQIELVADPSTTASSVVFTDYDLGDFVLSYSRGDLTNDTLVTDENGDPVTDENDDPVYAWGQYRVRQISIAEDENGQIQVVPDLASRYDEHAVRIQRTLARYLSINGDPSPIASLIVTPSTVVARRAKLITQTVNWPDTPTDRKSSPWTPEVYGRLAQVHLKLGVVDPSIDCDVDVFVNGTVITTATIDATDEEAFVFINEPVGPFHKIELQQTSTLTTGTDLTARLILTTYQGAEG